MNRNQYRKQWLRFHSSYERKAFSILKKSFKALANKIPLEHLNEETYMDLVRSNISDRDIFNIYVKIYKTIGIQHGNRIGAGINRDAKMFSRIIFENAYNRGLQSWLTENAGTRIVSVKDTFIKYIIDLIKDGITEQDTTIREIAKQIQKAINRPDFYRWQALRIARTETTAAANNAAIQAGNVSGFEVQDEWISIPDTRTRHRPEDRFDHRVMDGVKKERSEKFNVQGDMLSFPGDPNGQDANVINCRCTVATIPKRDGNGNLILTI